MWECNKCLSNLSLLTGLDLPTPAPTRLSHFCRHTSVKLFSPNMPSLRLDFPERSPTPPTAFWRICFSLSCVTLPDNLNLDIIYWQHGRVMTLSHLHGRWYIIGKYWCWLHNIADGVHEFLCPLVDGWYFFCTIPVSWRHHIHRCTSHQIDSCSCLYGQVSSPKYGYQPVGIVHAGNWASGLVLATCYLFTHITLMTCFTLSLIVTDEFHWDLSLWRWHLCP